MNFDVNDVTTINQSIDDELFSEHSSSTSYENDVILDRASYPDTLEVGKLPIVSNKIDDADKMNFDVNDVTTINNSIDDELFF